MCQLHFSYKEKACNGPDVPASAWGGQEPRAWPSGSAPGHPLPELRRAQVIPTRIQGASQSVQYGSGRCRGTGLLPAPFSPCISSDPAQEHLRPGHTLFPLLCVAYSPSTAPTLMRGWGGGPGPLSPSPLPGYCHQPLGHAQPCLGPERSTHTPDTNDIHWHLAAWNTFKCSFRVIKTPPPPNVPPSETLPSFLSASHGCKDQKSLGGFTTLFSLEMGRLLQFWAWGRMKTGTVFTGRIGTQL